MTECQIIALIAFVAISLTLLLHTLMDD